MKRALFYNFLPAVTCYGGLVIGIVVGESTDANMWIFGFAGGLFVYISLVAMVSSIFLSTGIPSGNGNKRKVKEIDIWVSPSKLLWNN